MVDGTTSWKAGTFPQQLRHQDLGAAGLQRGEESLLLTASEDEMELTAGEGRTVRHFLHYCLILNECNSRLHHQTKRSSGLK